MNTLFFFTILLVLAAVSGGKHKEHWGLYDADFTNYVTHYNELNCTPSIEMDTMFFRCDVGRDTGLCRYKNKYYRIGDTLGETDLDGECFRCTCANIGRDNLGFICSDKKCTGFADTWDRMKTRTDKIDRLSDILNMDVVDRDTKTTDNVDYYKTKQFDSMERDYIRGMTPTRFDLKKMDVKKINQYVTDMDKTGRKTDFWRKYDNDDSDEINFWNKYDTKGKLDYLRKYETISGRDIYTGRRTDKWNRDMDTSREMDTWRTGSMTDRYVDSDSKENDIYNRKYMKTRDYYTKKNMDKHTRHVRDASDSKSDETREISEQCIDQYVPGRCCSINRVCGHDIQRLNRCYVDGKEYVAGERFIKGCEKCVCDKTGTVTCGARTCGTDLRYKAEVRAFCAPVYDKVDQCCPVTWKCPKNLNFKIVNMNKGVTDMKCFYGDRTMNLGDRVIVWDHCLNCQCQVPPLVTCINMCKTPYLMRMN